MRIVEVQPGAVTVILSPFDAGLRDWRMGAGPTRLAAAGLSERLVRLGLDVTTDPVSSCVDDLPSELHRGFALQREIRARAETALDQGRFPILVSGDCNASLGVVAGLQCHGIDPAFLWCDAHADFHTPDTDPFGSLDSQGLAMLTGRAWRALIEQTQLQPLDDAHVALVGARALDPAEEQALSTTGISRLTVQQTRDEVTRVDALSSLGAADATHLHIDADALDPDRIGPANDFAAPGGLLPEDVIALATATASVPPLAALSVASFDPALDHRGAVATALLDIVANVVRSTLD